MADDTQVIATPGADTSAVADTGADTGLDFDIDVGTDTGTTTETQDASQDGQQNPPEGDRTQDRGKDDLDTRDFHGMVSGRIRKLVKGLEKELPEIGKVLAHPKVRDALEGPLRREAAYREVFPSLPEAKEIRARFPNGMQDVKALEEDIQEIEGVDALTYNRDQDGNYPGHGELISNIYGSDKAAAISLFKHLPVEWHRLDPASYNDVMGKIVGATLIGSGSWEQLTELREHAAATEGLKGIIPALDKILNRLSPFVEERRPDPGQEQLNRERQQFDRQREEANKQSQQQFDRSFGAENTKLQREVIGQHRIMQKLSQVKSITPAKRADIAEKVRTKMEQFLSKSPSFMRKLTEAYRSRNMEEAAKIQREAWGNQMLLNRMVREVLNVETPQLLRANQATVQARGVKSPIKAPTETNGNKRPTAPFKRDGRWFDKDGRTMSVADAMRAEMAST